MRKLQYISLIAGAMASFSAAPAMAFPLDLGEPSPQGGSWMQATENALAPLPYVKFCREQAEECRHSGENVLIDLDAATMSAMRRVNSSVNSRIRPQHHAVTSGVEDWSVNPAAGDCNDYAVTKRHELVAMGLPRSALLLAAVMTSWGEGHLVLVARTTRGDMVLDNLRGDIRSWDRAGYRWLKRESVASAALWEKMAQPSSRRVQMAAVAPAPAVARRLAPVAAEPVVVAQAPAADEWTSDVSAGVTDFTVGRPTPQPRPRYGRRATTFTLGPVVMPQWSATDYSYSDNGSLDRGGKLSWTLTLGPTKLAMDRTSVLVGPNGGSVL
ncbi:transglutaminase-like cysteine peptidase [Terrarubrum flagellatum]|uniref:transglutaminase-like cysteine peptidase n=1 Tax=Terrirubrum flagellatum TaxID=2895980 RepID=UPI003144E471